MGLNSKDRWGDWTRLELFISAIEGCEVGLRRFIDTLAEGE
jgi:hypothetical protein